MSTTKKAADGWHTVHGQEIYVEEGVVVRGVSDGRTTYPYRKDRTGNGWTNISREITLAAYSAGWRRGTIAMK